MRALRGRLLRALGIEPVEAGLVGAGFAMFLGLFSAYFLLRPVRETMGVAGGVDNLQWLFTGTFIATLLAFPLYGAVARRVPTRLILPVVFGFFVVNLMCFALALWLAPDHVWLARAFYIWLSVFNLIAISLAWSVLVAAASPAQAKRTFGLCAAGASVGGIVGPLLAIALVGPIGHAGLLLLSAALLLASTVAADTIARHGTAGAAAGATLGGNPFQGALDVARSPYLLGIAGFMVLLATVSTFLYVEQARLIELRFPDRADQTRVFGTLDAIVQTLSVLGQVFVTGRVARRLGLGALLIVVPLITVGGFLWLALAPGFAVLAVVMVLRRAGEYAFVRPGREMLYSVLSPSAKYQAKQFNDTVVYRGADAVSAWLKTALDTLTQQPALAMLAGASCALLWAVNGGWLARRQRALASTLERCA